MLKRLNGIPKKVHYGPLKIGIEEEVRGNKGWLSRGSEKKSWYMGGNKEK